MTPGRTGLFVRQLFARPGSTGAILPSSGALAARMLELAAPGPEAVIAEFGPGTGAFTRPILDSLGPGQKFFAIEVNENFAAGLEKSFPELSLHRCCASEVEECCRREGVGKVDCVISGLPWAIFPDDLRDRILSAMFRALSPGGVFVTFAYLQGLILPAGRKFKLDLRRRFAEVGTSGVVWLNLPPAVVYRCVKRTGGE